MHAEGVYVCVRARMFFLCVILSVREERGVQAGFECVYTHVRKPQTKCGHEKIMCNQLVLQLQPGKR